MHQLTLAESRYNKLTRQRACVLAAIRLRGVEGATDLEIQDDLGWSGDTERPRRLELQRAYRIKDSGLKRRTPRGGMATVWVVS